MKRLLYLHGFASGPDSVKSRYFRERLGEIGFELEIPDLNEGDSERVTISHQLNVLERAARGGTVSLIGSSLGGYLAALYAARHPEVDRLLLLAPAFDFAKLATDFGGPEPLIDDARQYEAFPATTQPVLIFHGTRDSDVPWALSKEFARRTPEVTLELVDADHRLLDAVGKIWGAAVVFFGLRV